MIVTCEKCETRFSLDDNLIKESGSKVRCSKCQHIFTAFKSAPPEAFPSPPAVEAGVDQPSEEAFEESLFSPQEELGLEGSEESLEESLDLDLFGAEGEKEDEFSLEDLTLDEDFAPEGLEARGQQLAAEEDIAGKEEITVSDLGFEEELAVEEVSGPAPGVRPGEGEGEEEIALEDLSLDQEAPFEDALQSREPVAEEEGIEEEEEISFEDLLVEPEPTEAAAGPAEEWSAGEEGEEEIALEDLRFEGEEAEEALPEEELPEEEPLEGLMEEEVEPPEPVSVAAPEEAEEVEDLTPLPHEKELPAKKRISTPLLAVLIIVLVGGAAYAGYTVLKSLNIKIPFLESLLGPQTSEIVDPGNLHASLLEEVITSEFVDNTSAGRLFVIKGQVRNDYPEARSFIRVKGVIYLENGKMAQNQMVYCGNILSEKELQTMDGPSIRTRLGNRFGDNKSNLKVPSGKALPFMIVFLDIPQELGEFSVEVVDSAKG